jgi:hypothetical protein
LKGPIAGHRSADYNLCTVPQKWQRWNASIGAGLVAMPQCEVLFAFFGSRQRSGSLFFPRNP